jgi:protein-L-isoaspartate(D-aspartate) O-methyltransferase
VIDLVSYRRFFADEIDALSNVKTDRLVDALAAVPRERFLPPGPWLVRGENDQRGPRHTRDADPRRVYHNYSIAIDPARQLFNGAPGAVVPAIDALELEEGDHALHVGAGLGYYSALMAHVVGPHGRVLALEVDEGLAASATGNLRTMPWAEARHGNGTAAFGETFDAILVSAGITHPQPTWLDALSIGARLVLPLTATFPAMGPLGKGFTTLVTRTSEESFSARPLAMTLIYSGIDLRDDALNAALGQALMRSPFPAFTRVRRDVHEVGSTCWLHGSGFCFATD